MYRSSPHSAQTSSGRSSWVHTSHLATPSRREPTGRNCAHRPHNSHFDRSRRRQFEHRSSPSAFDRTTRTCRPQAWQEPMRARTQQAWQMRPPGAGSRSSITRPHPEQAGFLSCSAPRSTSSATSCCTAQGDRGSPEVSASGVASRYAAIRRATTPFAKCRPTICSTCDAARVWSARPIAATTAARSAAAVQSGQRSLSLRFAGRSWMPAGQSGTQLAHVARNDPGGLGAKAPRSSPTHGRLLGRRHGNRDHLDQVVGRALEDVA